MPANAKPVNRVDRRCPVRVGERRSQLPEQVEDRNDEHQRCVLEQRNERIDQIWNDRFQGLRHDDETGHPPIAQAQRHRALELAARDRLQAAAHHFRLVGGGKQHHPDQHPQQPVDVPALRQEQRQHVGGEEQHRDQRHAAPELDEDDRQRADDREFRAAAERQQDAERQRADDAGEGDDQRHQQAAPQASFHMRQSEHAADQQDEGDDRKDPEEQHRVERFPRRARDQQRRQQDNAERKREVDPPALAVRVEAIHELAEFGSDERPARAHLVADGLPEAGCTVRPGPHRVDQQEFERRPAKQDNDRDAHDGQRRVERTVEQPLAHPSERPADHDRRRLRRGQSTAHKSGLRGDRHQRCASRMRALYQFISALVAKDRVR